MTPHQPLLSPEEIRCIDDSTMFHESPDWNERFARAIEAAVLARVAPKEPVAYCNVEMWKSGGKHWPDDCFSETPIEGYAPLYAAPSHQEGAKLQTDGREKG
jgi:hypothetical protein